MIDKTLWKQKKNETGALTDDVHVWLVNIENEKNKMENLPDILSPEERSRAGRFVFEKDKNSYIIAHGILRKILSQYTRLNPESIRFSEKGRGKPCLDHPEHGRIMFNLSHSGNHIIYAFTIGKEVGIDIELIKPVPDHEQIVQRFFSKKEIDEYFKLPVERREKAFFTCWTRKEAFIKALGEGLYFSLDKFSVSPDPDNKSGIEFGDDLSIGKEWFLHDIQIDDDQYVSAVVFEGGYKNINCWKWT